MKREGLYTHRLSHPASDRERVFAKSWREYCDNNGLDPLTFLFSSTSNIAEPYSERDDQIAATVIQWLGTNVGWCFLSEALQKMGFRIEKYNKSLLCLRCGDDRALVFQDLLRKYNYRCGHKTWMKAFDEFCATTPDWLAEVRVTSER